MAHLRAQLQQLRQRPAHEAHPSLAVDETVILLHPPLLLAGVSTGMERERQQHDSLVNGYPHQQPARLPQLPRPPGGGPARPRQPADRTTRGDEVIQAMMLERSPYLR